MCSREYAPSKYLYVTNTKILEYSAKMREYVRHDKNTYSEVSSNSQNI